MLKYIYSILPLFFSFNCFSQTVSSGTEHKINTTTINSQQHPATDMTISGNFVVVWESLDQDGDGYGIYGQLYNTGGTPQGSEFKINTTTNNDQRFPAVAMDNTGNFVVVWQSLNQDGNSWGIYMQRYNSTGTAQGTETLVNTTNTAGVQRLPSIAMNGTGAFAITWDNNFDIQLRLYNNTGSPLTGELLVNSTTTNTQTYPDIAMDNIGNFTVVWQSLGQDGSDYGIYMQRYNSLAAKLNAETLVNTTTANNQLSPAIAMDSLGTYAIVWVSNLQDGSAEGIYMRLFNNAGIAINTETKVNTTVTGAQDNPDIGMTEDGEILVAWNSYDQDGARYGVYQQAYYFSGSTTSPTYNKTSVETRVNTTITDFQQFPAIAMRHQQNGTVVWQEGAVNTTSSQDGSNYGIYSQLYTIPGGSSLPIELLTFNAKRSNPNEVQLNWITSTEINNKGFFVQRMNEQETQFENIAWVNGNGTTTEQMFYDLLDQNSAPTTTYYRLHQIDFDGSSSYSEIKAVAGVTTNSLAEVSTFPNPVDDLLKIKFHQLAIQRQNVTAQIINSNGQILHQFSQEIQSNQILEITFVKELVPALYILNIELENGASFRQKFIKV